MMAWRPVRGRHVSVLIVLLLGWSLEAVAEALGEAVQTEVQKEMQKEVQEEIQEVAEEAWEGTADSPGPRMQGRSVQTPLHGRRLFFTQQQRRKATYLPGSVMDDGIIDTEPAGLRDVHEDQSRPPGGSESGNSASATQSAVQDFVGVFFDGMVSGPRGTRLLVNGLPCSLVSSSSGGRRDDNSRVNCPTLTRSRPLLRLVLVSGRLQVSRDQSVLGLLKPGQGL